MKRKLIILLGLATVVGCTSFSTNLFRTEQSTTQLVYGAYVGYTNGLVSGTIKSSLSESNDIRSARIKFAVSVAALEQWRQIYTTNSAAKPQAQAALEALIESGSNVVNLINLIKIK